MSIVNAETGETIVPAEAIEVLELRDEPSVDPFDWVGWARRAFPYTGGAPLPAMASLLPDSTPMTRALDRRGASVREPMRGERVDFVIVDDTIVAEAEGRAMGVPVALRQLVQDRFEALLDRAGPRNRHTRGHHGPCRTRRGRWHAGDVHRECLIAGCEVTADHRRASASSDAWRARLGIPITRRE